VDQDNLDALEILSSEKYWPKLTKWEQQFLDSLERRDHWTERQQEFLDRIWKEVVVERRRE